MRSAARTAGTRTRRAAMHHLRYETRPHADSGTIMRRRAPLLLALVLSAHCQPSDVVHELADAVMDHLKILADEAHDMFIHFCQPSDPSKLTATYARDEVEIPSCSALREAGLEGYYGNINMLMEEAWIAKIHTSLQFLSHQPDLPQPAAELLLVREPADGLLAGGIFISQLLQYMPDGYAVLSDVALMIGIHRTPKHKMLRHVGRQPDVNVTQAIVQRAQQWAADKKLSALYVCPLEGDGGALRARLADLGFRDEDDAPDRGHLALGNLALRGDVCEEAVLMAYRPVQQVWHEEL